MADDPTIFLLAGALPPRERGEVGAAELEAGLRLRHVGLGDVADLEAVRVA